VESSLHRLLPLLDRERVLGRAVVLATVLQTAGSTYRKAGAQMLLARSGEYAGLLSGGCLEGDLREHARRVLELGRPQLVTYDMRGPEDLLFGLGAGCEGAMDIFLLPIGPHNDWQPLARLAESLEARRQDALAIVVESALAQVPPGTIAVASMPAAAPGLDEPRHPVITRLLAAARQASGGPRVSWFDHSAGGVRAFITPLVLPPALLVLGAGPDARPLVELAAFLGWHVTVADHRSAYADPLQFPRARRVLHARPEELPGLLEPAQFDAAIVMSHHLTTDLAYLRVLGSQRLSYVGLLGPAARRERLLSQLGAESAALLRRLRAPVGLDIGARTPEAIALAIIAEVHAALEARAGGPLSHAEEGHS
jgi:xanthine/CO dehydrogenase XdhC/CoxF family maturation factor